MSGVRSGTSMLSDTELADLIESDIRAHPGEACARLTGFIEGVPGLADRSLALDAAIGAVLETGPPEELAHKIRAAHPELSARVDDALLMGELVDAVCAPGDRGPAPEQIGEALPDGRLRYEVVERLGGGAVATVYRAHDRLLSGEDEPASVAIKLYTRISRHHDPIAEARASRRVTHPGVVRTLDFGRDAHGRAYIVYELFAGRSLHEWMPPVGELPVRACARVVLGVARGVEAIHACGLVHHDIKPQNILIGPGGEVKIIDFGLARDSRGESGVGGTPGFGAPEQFGEQAGVPAPSCDVFALGALLHWMLSGRGVGTGGVDIKPLGLDRTLSAVLGRALRLDPGERYQSAGELARDLDDWCSRRPVEWTRPSVLGRGVLLVRRRPIMVGVGAAAIIGAGVFSGLVKRSAVFEERADAATEHAEQASEERDEANDRNAKAARTIFQAMVGLKMAEKEGFSEQLLTSLWVYEWMHGTGMLDSPIMLQGVWGTRADLLGAQLEGIERAGRDGTLAANIVRTSLALWLVWGGEYTAARAHAEEAEMFWAESPYTDDPWRMQNKLVLTLARHGETDDEARRGAIAEEALRLHGALGPGGSSPVMDALIERELGVTVTDEPE